MKTPRWYDLTKNIKHRKNGTYSCIVYLKDPMTGKTRPKWKGGFASEKEAERELIRWQNEINENRYNVDAEMKLSVYLQSWLDLKKKSAETRHIRRLQTQHRKAYQPEHWNAAAERYNADHVGKALRPFIED